MASQGLFSIGGIASGLDTSSIITQLLQLERQPVVRLQSTQAALRTTDEAWAQVATRISALRTATDAISRVDRFSSLTAVRSSAPDAVSVTRSAEGGVGALDFTVERLAAAQQVGVRFPSGDGPLVGERLTVQVGDGAVLAVGLDGRKTPAEVARELNAARGGVTATVVRGDDGAQRLVLTATQSGARNAIRVEGGEAEVDVLREAVDAVVAIGSGAAAIRVSRPGNVISDLVPGATVTLRSVTTHPVEVTASRDVDGAVTAVRSYVDALNGAMSTLRAHTSYNADTKAAGALQGDPSARRLLAGLRAAVGAPLGVDLGPISASHQLGMGVDRHGTVILDEAKLRAALTADFAGVARAFARAGSATTAEATGVLGSAATPPGTYQIRVTQAAEVARATGTPYTPPAPDAARTFRITGGGRTAVVTIGAAETDVEAAAVRIRSALAEQGVTGVDVAATEGRLTLSSSRYGAAAQLVVTGGAEGGHDGLDDVFGLAGTHGGVDVAGEIRGADADAWAPLRGVGRELSATGSVGTGLSFTYEGAPATFDVTWSPGLAGAVGIAVTAAQGVTGVIARARAGITSQIGVYQTRIDAFDQRLATREATLRRQFTAMETALSSLNAQGSWLASQLPGLNALHRQS